MDILRIFLNFVLPGRADKLKMSKRMLLLLATLNLQTGMTLESFGRLIAETRNADIEVFEVSLPGSVSAFSIRAGTSKYVIYQNKARRGRLLWRILLHELIHIYAADADNLPCVEPEKVLKAVQSGKDLRLIEGIVCRGSKSSDPAWEKDIDRAAIRILEKLRLEEEANAMPMRHWLIYHT